MTATKAPKETITMNPTPAHEHTLRMVLMIAACFAIGSLGLFLAVLLEPSIGTKAGPSELTVTQEKENAMESLAASQHVVSSSTPPESAAPTPSGVPAQEADTDDTAAAAKLKVLESLNGQ